MNSYLLFTLYMYNIMFRNTVYYYSVNIAAWISSEYTNINILRTSEYGHKKKICLQIICEYPLWTYDRHSYAHSMFIEYFNTDFLENKIFIFSILFMEKRNYINLPIKRRDLCMYIY